MGNVGQGVSSRGNVGQGVSSMGNVGQGVSSRGNVRQADPSKLKNCNIKGCQLQGPIGPVETQSCTLCKLG